MMWFIWSLLSAIFAAMTAILAKLGVSDVDANLATGASWLCYFCALQVGPASRVAPVDKLSVVFVIILAAVFLGEPITAPKVLGGALIAIGAAVLAFG